MANTYNCIRCGFQTNRKSILINHINKKNKCKKILNTYFIPDDLSNEMSKIPRNLINNDYQCIYCLKNYSCKFNLNRHIKNCSFKDRKNQSILVKYKLCNYVEINKYLSNFYNLTILKYFEENKIYNSFFKPWNINHIDLLTKKLLFISNDKYSDLLRKILENDKNINIIFDKNESYGYIINDHQNIEIINKKKIVIETMKKILNTFELFRNQLENNDKIIDQSLLNKEYNNIYEKYEYFLTNNNVNIRVENIILNLYYDKFKEIQNNALFELNNINIGF